MASLRMQSAMLILKIWQNKTIQSKGPVQGDGRGREAKTLPHIVWEVKGKVCQMVLDNGW